MLQPVEAGGLIRVDGESSFGVGFLTDGDTPLGVGVFDMVDPFVAPGCYAIGEAPPYLFDMEVGGAKGVSPSSSGSTAASASPTP